MIKISRPAEPAFFNTSRRTTVLEEVGRLGTFPQGKRIPFYEDIITPFREVIAQVFAHKCAFCESTAHFPTSGGIDHFRPRSGCRTGSEKDAKFLRLHYSWLAYDWDNLYLVCNVCNKHRRDYFPLSDESTRAEFLASKQEVSMEARLLIDPCVDDPALHITFSADGQAFGLTAMGLISIDLFGLNRSELVRLRYSAIESFRHFYERSRDNELEEEMAGYLADLMLANTRINYAGAIRAVAEDIIKEIDQSRRTDLKKVDFKASVSTIGDDVLKRAENPWDPEQMHVESNFKIDEIKNFSIRSVEISNFKSVESLTLNIEPSIGDVSGEPWLLLLGDNGIGKSSILQAIALGLCGQKQIDQMDLKAADYLTRGKRKGFVKIFSHERDEPIVLDFDRAGFRSSSEECLTYVLGYGSTRLLPKGELKSPKRKDSLVHISNLFDYSVALVDVNKWFRKLHRSPTGINELKLRILPALQDLLDMEEGYTLVYKSGGLRFERDAKNHLLEGVSDGFKSVIGLAVDIMMSLSSDIGSYHSTQGIVLVDELGNHLHPRWRMKIVAALRRAFPNLQFVVSTHEPLCLRGLAHGEVNVLLTKEDKLIKLDKLQLPDHNLLRVDQLLTSDLFGLINTMDEATEKKYQHYYALLSIPELDRTLQEKALIVDYTKTLSEKELMGSSPKDQAIFAIVSETWGNKVAKEGFKTVGELKEETISEVKGMIKNRQLDWL